MVTKRRLKTGISTGACAAAAAKAAALAWFSNEYPTLLSIKNPEGKEIGVTISRYINTTNGIGSVVIKDGGDDPDVTHGLDIIATLVPDNNGTITIKGGEGVGTVTQPGLQVGVGLPAINPVPEWMIRNAVSEALPPGKGCIITISVPGGETVAKRTLNPRLGIEGGISILGTSGIVRPMSEEAYKNSLVPMIDMAIAYGYDTIILTPGRLGAKWAINQGFTEQSIVEMGNFVGFMLDQCVDKGIKQVLLWGHCGKLVKVAAGIFHTHSKLADARQETFAALAACKGASPGIVSSILNCTTTEAIVDILYQQNLTGVIEMAVQRASARATAHVKGELTIGTAMLSMAGDVLAFDEQALVIGRDLGWQR